MTSEKKDSSFLKKRSKRLLFLRPSHDPSKCTDRSTAPRTKVFWFFSSEKNIFLLKSFLAGAFVGLTVHKLFEEKKRLPPSPDPFGPNTGRGPATAPPSEAAIAEGYEVSDANGRNLAITIAIFAAAAAAAIGSTILALHLFGGAPPQYSNFTQSQRHHITPPAPHLQADPVADLARFQSQENTALTTYAKTAPGLAHIPIARALALTQGKPLDPAPMVQP